MRVLMVDDEIDYLRSITRVLTSRGFDVQTASDGPSAIASIERTQFDCVVLDLKMPGMDGLATLGELRKRDDLTPVLLLTGQGDVPTVVSALKGGSDGFLMKPCPVEELVSAIEDAGERKALARALQGHTTVR